MLLHYLGKLKIQIFCRCGRKRKQSIFTCYSSTNFDVFGVQNSETFSVLIVNNILGVTDLLLIYFYRQFVPALQKRLRQLMT